MRAQTHTDFVVASLIIILLISITLAYLQAFLPKKVMEKPIVAESKVKKVSNLLLSKQGLYGEFYLIPVIVENNQYAREWWPIEITYDFPDNLDNNSVRVFNGSFNEIVSQVDWLDVNEKKAEIVWLVNLTPFEKKTFYIFYALNTSYAPSNILAPSYDQLDQDFDLEKLPGNYYRVTTKYIDALFTEKGAGAEYVEYDEDEILDIGGSTRPRSFAIFVSFNGNKDPDRFATKNFDIVKTVDGVLMKKIVFERETAKVKVIRIVRVFAYGEIIFYEDTIIPKATLNNFTIREGVSFQASEDKKIGYFDGDFKNFDAESENYGLYDLALPWIVLYDDDIKKACVILPIKKQLQQAGSLYYYNLLPGPAWETVAWIENYTTAWYVGARNVNSLQAYKFAYFFFDSDDMDDALQLANLTYYKLVNPPKIIVGKPMEFEATSESKLQYINNTLNYSGLKRAIGIGNDTDFRIEVYKR